MQIVTGIEVNSEADFQKLREYCPSAEGTRAIFPQLNKTNSDCHHRSIVSLISRSCGNISRVPSALGQYSRNYGK